MTQSATPIVVFGGYGVFGSLIAEGLHRRRMTVAIAGRDASKAEAFARRLGPPSRARVADVTRIDSCRRALSGARVAVNAAGPFLDMDVALLDACLSEQCHYVDISDNRDHAARVLAASSRFRDAGLAAVFGASSLPGISGALALAARDARQPPLAARVTLFIGNDNPKGFAAVSSAVHVLGKTIRWARGTRRGFADPEKVDLPEPFGRRTVHNFESPDLDLLPSLLGTQDVRVKVGFEARAANGAFALLARLGSDYGARTTRLLLALARLAGRRGHSGGAVLVELRMRDGSVRRACLSSSRDAQRMAGLPAVLAATRLASNGQGEAGALAVYELLGPDMLRAIAAEGFTLELP